MISASRGLRAFLAAICLLVTVGCGSSEEDSGKKTSGVRVARKKPDEQLEPVKMSDGQPIPDRQGRVEVSLPVGWRSRFSKGCIAELYKDHHDTITRIQVLVEKYDRIKNVSADNQQQFAATLQETLFAEIQEKGLDPTKVLSKKPTPISLGNFMGVRYVRRGRVKTPRGTQVTVLRLFLVTVVDDWKYSVVLRAMPKDLRKYRGVAHAVATHLKFAAPANLPSPKTPEETPAAVGS
jgi:hypothetical protein